jgi:prolyl 4-hydroxylase
MDDDQSGAQIDDPILLTQAVATILPALFPSLTGGAAQTALATGGPEGTRLELRDGIMEAAARSEAAHDVRAQIPTCGKVLKIPSDAIELYIVRDFLTAAQCAELIAVIDADLVPSPVVADDPLPAYRTSQTCYLQPFFPVVGAVETALNRVTGIDPMYGETLQGQRYAVGQQFKPHHDFFDTAQRYWEEQVTTGGHRTWTAMAFLNEPAGGGWTNFPTAKVSVTPRTGNLLIWNNMDEIGTPNQATLHQGMPVEQGVKYIVTKWYRERPWCR